MESNKVDIGSEYLFRVYDKRNGKWLKPKWGGEITVGDGIVIFRDFKPNKNGGYSFDKYRVFQIDIDIIVMRYIGLNSNGNKIFEGDVVNDVAGNAVVVFHDGAYKLYYPHKYNQFDGYPPLRFEWWKYVRIIGNMIDSPELLRELEWMPPVIPDGGII